MQHRKNVLRLAVLSGLAGYLSSIACGGQLQTSQSATSQAIEVENHQDDDRLPSITYGNTRRSSHWVQTNRGTRVAVDEGIEYDGIKYYLGLTWHLLAVDSADNQTIWSKHVSAFWNRLSVEMISPDGAEESKIAVIALRTGRDDETKDQVAYYDLKSGAEIKDPNRKPEDLGTSIKLRASFRGDRCQQSELLVELVSAESRWHELYDKIFKGVPDSPPRDGLFDDAAEVALVVVSGNTQNCAGISASSVFENEDRVLVRLHYHTYQSDGATPTVQPYGIIVLPKRKDKKYVVERNRQRFIGGPPLWKRWKAFEIDEP